MKAILKWATRAVALSVVLTASAQAAELFVINVPVEFKSLHPDVVGVEVTCHLRGKDPVTGNLIYYAKKLPYAGAMGKTTALKPVNGDVPAQTVKFAFSTEDFESPELANLSLVTMGECNFGLRAKDGNLYNPAAVAPSATTVAPKPGAPFKSSVTVNF